MTKEEIKKALKCCDSHMPNACGDCPYCWVEECKDKLIADVLTLITEQEEHIKIQNQQLSDWEKNYTQSFERLKSQQREIEFQVQDRARLQREIDELEQAYEQRVEEIEQLKAKNDTNVQYIRMMGIQSHIKTSNERVKQAQIDVLNKAKEKIVEHMVNREYMGVKYKQGVFSESEIDEMIEELKK